MKKRFEIGAAMESDTEYIDTTYTPEKIREILFGEWKVSKFLGFTKVQNDYAIYPDGHDIIGDHIVINEHTFSSERIEKYERYQCELSDPVYRVSSIKEMYAKTGWNWQIGFCSIKRKSVLLH